MALLKVEVKGDAWPSIMDGERTDRGWEHFLQPQWSVLLAAADNVQARFQVPGREVWFLEYLRWQWTAVPTAPEWTTAELLRELRTGQLRQPNKVEWVPLAAAQGIDRTLYTIPPAEARAGLVQRSGIERHVCGLGPEARWGFNWLDSSVADTCDLQIWMQVVRIPLAKERHWTKQDMGNALTRIEELGRRVS